MILPIHWPPHLSVFHPPLMILVLCSTIIGIMLSAIANTLPNVLIQAWEAQATETLNMPHLHRTAHTPAPLTLSLVQRLAFNHLATTCLVTILTLMLTLYCVHHFKPGLTCYTSLILIYGLIVLCVIDVKHQLLPDLVTLPLLWLGLLANLFHPFATLYDAVLGAVFGYLILFSLFWLYKWLTQKEGMGYGDFKLLACLGAWLGWPYILPILFLSALIGILLATLLKYAYQHDFDRPFAYGPCLSCAGIICLFWGKPWLNIYLTLFT